VLQIAAVEVPEESMGSVVELLGKRRGQMVDMEANGFVPYFHQFIELVKCSVTICIIF
jgi:predicted membrane GTPase involved in stress response